MRISKSFLYILLAASSLAVAETGSPAQNTVDIKVASAGTYAGVLSPLGRPFLLRSDAVSDANYEALRGFARIGIDPRTGIHYDGRGFPRLNSVFDVQLKPSQFRSPIYGKICNEKLLDEIRNNPVLRRRFSARDIELLENGRNPQGKHWHHDPRQKGRFQLVDANEHTVDHVGGDKVWGRIDENAFAKATAIRWGSVAVFDIALSSAGLLYSDDFDLEQFMRVTTRSAAGGAAAFGTEYLLVKFMPQTVGLTPRWFAGLRILYGSPAAWVASLSYAATRALIDYCWDRRRLEQLQIQETACRAAESQARWQRIEPTVKANTDDLMGLLANRNEGGKGIK